MALIRRYFLTPNFSVAANFRVGTHSICRAILSRYYPYLPIIGDWWESCPHERVDPSREPVLLVRDPVQRFISALGLFRITDVDAILNCLERCLPYGNFSDGDRWPYGDCVSDNWHFASQSCYLPARCFAFPQQLADFMSLLDLDHLPCLNSSPDKSIVTDEQAARIRLYYETDQKLFEYTTAGISHDLPPEPTSFPTDSRCSREVRKSIRLALVGKRR